MRMLMIVMLCLVASPGLAADCHYSSEHGDRLSFDGDGQNTVSIARKDGPRQKCSWATTPDGPSYFSIQCDKGDEEPFFFGASKPGLNPRDLLAFENQIWYSSCAQDIGL